MKLLLINTDGGGFAGEIEVAEGTTIQRLFADRFPTGKAENYLIRVNRLPASANQELRPGDRVSITPTKIEGAA